MKTKPIIRNESVILRELGSIDEQIAKYHDNLQPVPFEFVKQKTQLRHELKLVKMTPATGEDAQAIKQYWEGQRRTAQKRLQSLKKQVGESYSVEELEKMLKKAKTKK